MAYDLLSETTPRVVFIGSGTRGPFTFSDGGTPIRVRTASHLVARRYSSTTDEDGTLLVLNTDYTVNVTDPDNVTLTLTVAQDVLASTERLVVERSQPITGVIEYATGGDFSGPALSDAISVLSEQVQELAARVGRSIKTDWRETVERALPIAPTTAPAYLYRDSDGSIGQTAEADIQSVADNLDDIQTVAEYIAAQGLGLVLNSEAAAAANTIVLQALLTANEGGQVELPAGDIWLTASTGYACVTAPTGGIRIVGKGKYNTVLRISGTTGAAHIAAIDADKFEIEHVGFRGDATTAAVDWQRPLVLRGVQLCTVANCFFYQCGGTPLYFGTEGLHGTDSIANGTRRCEKVFVDKNVIVDCWGTVAVVTKFNGAADFTVTNNIIINSCTVAVSFESQDNLSGGATAYGFWAERCVISDNIIYNLDYQHSSGLSPVAYGISVTESVRYVSIADNIIDTIAGSTLSSGIAIGTSPDQTDETARVISVTGNIISGVTSSAGRGHNILFQVGDTSVDSITISGNTTDGGEVGLTLVNDYSTDTLGEIIGLNVTGNTFNMPTEFGIWSDTQSSSGSLPTRNATFTGNIIRQAGSNGIAVFTTGCTFVGNQIIGCGGAGLFFNTGSKNNTLTGNTISDNCGNGLSGDLTSSMVGVNMIIRNGQTQANGYNIYATAGTDISIQGCRASGGNNAALAQGSTPANVAYSAFKVYIAAVEYSIAASAAAGIAPGNDVIPISTYGAVAFEVGTNGTVDVIEATNNATGYASAALAIAGLPAKQADHVRFGHLTVIKTDGAFTFGTTSLSAANVTAVFTSAITDYGIRFANAGQTIRNCNLKNLRLATIFGGIGSHNTGTYDAGLNWTA